MGTALTADHLRNLRNALPPAEGAVILVLDGDAAGVRAAERACKDVLLALEGEERMGGVQVKVAELPRGEGQPKDPADFVLVRGWVGWSCVCLSSFGILTLHPSIHPFAIIAGQGPPGRHRLRGRRALPGRVVERVVRHAAHPGGDAADGDLDAAVRALREDTALFSKRSGALTDFLSRLPPTRQVGGCSLARWMASLVDTWQVFLMGPFFY